MLTKIASSQADFFDCMTIRTKVFIIEQNIPADMEIDEYDQVAIHFILRENNQAIATARVLLCEDKNNAKVGRVAVLSSHQNKGYGKQLMLDVEKLMKANHIKQLSLSSQEHAIKFYQKIGYQVVGDFYDDCGIPHIDMIKTI